MTDFEHVRITYRVAATINQLVEVELLNPDGFDWGWVREAAMLLLPGEEVAVAAYLALLRALFEQEQESDDGVSAAL